MPQPALPEVSVLSPRPLAHEAGLKPAAGALRACRLHGAEQLAPLALRNQRLFYSLLFRAASETLLEIAADPRHLGARIGALAVLHTCRMSSSSEKSLLSTA